MQEIRSCVHSVIQYLSQQETQELSLRLQLDTQMRRDSPLNTKNHHTLKSIANTSETQCHVNPCVRKRLWCPDAVFATKGNYKWCHDDICFFKKNNQGIEVRAPSWAKFRRKKTKPTHTQNPKQNNDKINKSTHKPTKN